MSEEPVRGEAPAGAGRILVTGATGFIGFEVARLLAETGRRPRLMVRRRSRARLLTPLDAELVQGDLMRPATLDRVLEGVDAVIHLAARATFERYAKVRPTIVDGSRALMRAARNAGVRRFVFASSLLVYDSTRSAIGSETPPRPQIGYGRAKLEAEEMLRAEAGDEVALSILRLPHVYGARSFLFDQIARGRVVMPGDGRTTHAHLHVADAARVLAAAADRGWVGSSPVADLSRADWNEFYEVLNDHYDGFRVIRVPRPLAIAGATALEWLADLRGRPTLFSPDSVRGWCLNLPIDCPEIWRELALEPHYPSIEQGLPACLDERVAFRWRHPLQDASRALAA